MTVHAQALPLPGDADASCARAASRCPTAARCASTRSSPRGRARAPPRLGARAVSAACSRFPRQVERAARLGARVGVRAPARRVRARRPAYFAPQILIGGATLHGPGIDARGAAFAGVEPLRAARPRPRLRVERHLGRPGHHRHLRGHALRAGRLGRRPRLDALPLPRRSACRSRCSSARNSWTPNAGRPTRRRAPRRCAPSAPSSASSPRARPPSRASRWRTRSCGRPTSTRPTRRSGFARLQQPERRSATPRRLPAGRLRKIGFTFNWFYIDYAATSPTSTRATTRCGPRASTSNFPVRRRASSGATWNPDCWSRARYTPIARRTRR